MMSFGSPAGSAGQESQSGLAASVQYMEGKAVSLNFCGLDSWRAPSGRGHCPLSQIALNEPLGPAVIQLGSGRHARMAGIVSVYGSAESSRRTQLVA
jgi:hypothetical protein